MNQPTVPESRLYLHQKCNTVTVVAGQSFECLSDPLSDMSRTWCSTCEAFFPLSDFQRADTGEKITDYYARHGARATKIERFLCSRLSFYISAVIGFLVGVYLSFIGSRNDGQLVRIVMIPFSGMVGFIVFGSLKEFFLTKLIIRQVCGVSDTRMLK